MTAIEIIKAEARKQDTQTILDAVLLIGGGMVETAKRMTRAALIEVYVERTSADEAEALMDLIGL